MTSATAKSRHADGEEGAGRAKAAAPVGSFAGLEEETGDGVDFGPLTGYLGYYLRRLQQGYKKHFLVMSGDLGIQPRDVGALFVIGLNPGLTPSKLSAALAMDGAQITNMLNSFDARGWVVRQVSDHDGRSRVVYLTPEGQKTLARLRQVTGKVDRSFVSGRLNDEEITQLIALCAKLLAGGAD